MHFLARRTTHSPDSVKGRTPRFIPTFAGRACWHGGFDNRDRDTEREGTQTAGRFAEALHRSRGARRTPGPGSLGDRGGDNPDGEPITNL